MSGGSVALSQLWSMVDVCHDTPKTKKRAVNLTLVVIRLIPSAPTMENLM